MPSPFYHLARETAKIILEYSWDANNVRDVLLYGSTLTSDAPHDMDLLILHHRGARMDNYSVSWSVGASEDNPHYYRPTVMLHELGYNGEEANGVFYRVCRLFDWAHLIDWDGEDWHPERINQVLDLHMLDTHLITDPSEYRLSAWYAVTIPQKREEAIRFSGKDPYYYHRVLSGGRLYDPSTGDFTMPFEEKYPGKIALFPSPQ